MPITGPTSYLPTLDEFLAHWLLANTALGAGNELILPGGITLADLQALHDALATKIDLLQQKLTAVEIARGEIDSLKVALHLRLNQLVNKVRAQHEGSKWARALPFVPSVNDGQGNFMTPMDVANSVWLLINADATIPDITLLGAYTQVMFAADVVLLKEAYTAYNTAKTVADVVREERNDLQDEIYEILRKYRRNLPTAFSEGHALVDSLPRLTPEPGSTPDGVTAAGVWDAALQMARITFTASSDPNLTGYQLRFCAGPNYSTEDEAVVASLGPNDPREFLTNAGLTEPGNVATFKVYVITSTGNEKGSNIVTITRPTEA